MTRRMAATFVQPSGLSEVAGIIAAEIRRNIQEANVNSDRSQQKMVGPSELGVECLRRLAYRMLLWQKVNVGGGSWATDIGKAVHAYLEGVWSRLDPERFWVERRVNIRGGIAGTADLYDRNYGMVLDWKVVGESMLEKYKRNGPGPQYETQAQLYGLGFENAGEDVKRVAIVFLPRSHTLENLHVWVAPYDRDVALAALDRFDGLMDLLGAIDVETHPERWGMVPATPGSSCDYCPWFLPKSNDLAIGCPGATA